MRAQNTECLCRRGNQYYFRRAIPLQYRNLFGRGETKVSLGTDKPGSARRRCRYVTDLSEQLIALAIGMPELSHKRLMVY